MSKLTITQKVSETNYYNNSTDADRTYDVSAKVTIGGESAAIINEGVVRAKGGDVIVASFSKGQYESLRMAYAGTEIVSSEVIMAVTEAVCDFIGAIGELGE